MKRRRVVNAAAGREPRRRSVVGVHAVREYLRVRPEAIVEVVVGRESAARHRAVLAEAEAAGVRVSTVPAAVLDARYPSDVHQGVVAMLHEFAYAALADVVAQRPHLIVATDGIEDPRNLGALIRSVAAAGAKAVIIPQQRAAQVTAAVEKAAAGTTAWFPVCRVVNVSRTLRFLKERHGFWIIGLAQDGPADLFRSDLPLPAVLVLGGETGLRPLVTRHCDVMVRIPMEQGVESLNVAVAGAVVGFELRRRGV